MKQLPTLVKVCTVLALSGFMLGNTKCEKPVETRQLKKNVKLISLEASNFLDNSGFSFSEVAQSQFSGVLFEKNYFFERTVYPTVEWSNGFNDQRYFGVQKAVAPSEKSMIQLKAWFPDLKAQDVVLNRESACFMNRPQHFIAGKINSLEAYSGASLSFGFNQNLVQVPVSANVKMDKMRMDLSFHAFDPWTNQVTTSVNAEAFKKDYKAGFGIDLGFFHIGPEFYRLTGMSEVTLAGLKAGVEKLAQSLLSKPRQEWSTRVMLSRDNYVVIVGGAELGLKKGDQLKVFNEVHTWTGTACGESSILTGSTIISDTKEPWIVEIVDAGNLMSHARVLNIKEDESIATGALVQLHQFVKEQAAPEKSKK